MESNKNREWEKFSFEAYKRIVREGHIIPTYITCIELILHRKNLNPKLLKKKAVKQP